MDYRAGDGGSITAGRPDIVFQTVITASHAIRRRIEKRLEAWRAGKHAMLFGNTLRSCKDYLTSARREETAEHRSQTYHSLVLCGKLRSAVRWITERGTGEVLQPAGHQGAVGGPRGPPIAQPLNEISDNQPEFCACSAEPEEPVLQRH